MKNNNKDNILTHIFLPGEEEEKKIYLDLCILRDSQVMLVLKNPPVNAGDIRNIGLIPGSGRSPGEGRGNALQYSCLQNPMDRGAWRTTAHRVAKSWTQLKQHSTYTQCVLR